MFPLTREANVCMVSLTGSLSGLQDSSRIGPGDSHSSG
jgi:hypothetical protein